jgi:hypothetical protein
MCHKVFLLFFALLASLLVAAQPMRKSIAKNDSTNFKIQTNYLSNYVYNGRSDSLKAPYFYTTATVNFTNGLYASFSLNYLLTPGQTGYDFSELDLGYYYYIGEKISGEVYGAKYFYSSGSNLLSGNISSDIGFTFNYELPFINFHNSFDVFFSNKADMQLVPGFEKEIMLNSTNHNTLSVTPAIYSSFSSLNFYESTISRRLNGIRNPKIKQPPTAGTLQSTTTVNQKGFKLLSLELAMPVSYDTKNWNISLTPTYAIPFNKISTTSVNTSTINGISKKVTINSTPYSENNLANIFFFDIGITYKF